MSLFGSATATTTASSSTPAQGDLKNDVAVKDIQDDSISSIAFSPQADYLAGGSWNKEVRIWEIDASGNSIGRAQFKHEGPVLDVAWSKDGTKVFGAGSDKAVRMLDLNNPTNPQQVAGHEASIKCVASCTVGGTECIVTGGWDKKVRYWDLRSPQPAMSLDVPDRVYAMDTREKLLVIGTADRFCYVVNLDQPGQFYKKVQSPLKWQTRTISTFADATGFAIGSVEGRCAIQYVEDKDATQNFSFKCHRSSPPNQKEVSNVYSVNAISFHPVHGTFSTAGSDGTFHFWDKDAKHRLKGYPEVGQTIVDTCFNKSGTIFAYAAAYDWSKGFQGHMPGAKNTIMLHPVQGDECKPRPKQGGRR